MRRRVRKEKPLLSEVAFGLISCLGDKFRFLAALQLPEPKRTREAEKVIRVWVKKGEFLEAQRGTRLLGRDLAPGELERFIRQQIRLGHYENVFTLIGFRGRDLTAKELNALFRKHWQQFSFMRGSRTIASCLPEPQRTERLEFLIRHCVRRGYIDDAREAAGLVGRELTRNELQTMLDVWKAQGRLDGVIYAAKLLRRKPTAEEVLAVINAQVVSTSDRGFIVDNILQALQLLPRDLRLARLKKIIALPRARKAYDFCKLLGQLPEPERTQELLKVVEAGLSAGETESWEYGPAHSAAHELLNVASLF